MIPILNNNDVVAPDFDFIDNDHLAAYVAGMLGAELLVLVSDVHGIFDRDPTDFPGAKRIDYLPADFEDWPEIKARRESISNGGLDSKIDTMRLMVNLGISCRVVSNQEPQFIVRSLDLEETFGTTFRAIDKQKARSGYGKWLVTGAVPKGMILVSALGADALSHSKNRVSLLAIGVERVFGRFDRGDIVSIRDFDYNHLGIGKVRFSSGELLSMRARPSKDGNVVVHADELARKSGDFFAYDRKNVTDLCATVRKFYSTSRYGNDFVVTHKELGQSERHTVSKEDHRAAWSIGVSIDDWLTYRVFNNKPI